MGGLISSFFTAPTIDRGSALRRMEQISAATHVMSSLEHLSRPGFRVAGGLNNWVIAKDSAPFRGKFTRKALDTVARPAMTNAVHAVRVAAGIAAILPGGGRRRRLLTDTTLALTSLAMHPRHHYGTDGSDQAAFLVQAASAFARCSRRPAVQDAALWAVGLQGTLSYAASGWAKLAGPSWRQGRALEGVTRTMTYGDEWTWRQLQRFPLAARVLGASVLALECAAPVIYAAGGRLAGPYAWGTTALHLGIARTMALGRFVPAFTSMHPAMLYTARPQRSTMQQPGGRRDDTVVRASEVLAAAAAATGLVTQVLNRRRVLAAHDDDEFLHTTDGASLAIRRSGAVGADGPVYLFENALLGTPEHWSWIAATLGAEHEVVTYQRAGYGPSRPGPTPVTDLQQLVSHAVQVAGYVARGRPLVLVGHSLGGYLAMLTAQRLGDKVGALALVDSSHPQEMQRSTRQAAGAKSLTDGFPMLIRSLQIGCGVMLPVPDWVRALPSAAQRSSLAQYRDARMWRAGRREWAATVDAFGKACGLPTLTVPILGLSAQATVLQDSAQREMHQEMVAAGHPSGRHRVIGGATHDSIVTDQSIAGRVGRYILEFVATAASGSDGSAGSAGSAASTESSRSAEWASSATDSGAVA